MEARVRRSIDLSVPVLVEVAQARAVLLDGPGVIFGDDLNATTQEHPDARANLSVDLGGGASIHQEVVMQFGAARSTATRVTVPVVWRATGRERWFATFTGEVALSETRRETRLRLNGTYTVPLGVVGRVGDVVLGRRLAHQSLEALLGRVAQSLESEVERRGRRSVNRRTTHEPVAPPMWERSEIYIG